MTYNFTTLNDPLATSAPPNSAVEEFVTSGTFVFGIAPTTNTVVGGYVDIQGNPAGFSYNGSTFTSMMRGLPRRRSACGTRRHRRPLHDR
jgi:hypothetical protein